LRSALIVPSSCGDLSTISKRNKLLILGAGALALGGVGVAAATGGDDSEQPITGSALDKAEAGLEHTGAGSVTDTKVGDEESYYEVEVTLDDGSQTDVQLNRDFTVMGDESDAGEPEDGAGDD